MELLDVALSIQLVALFVPVVMGIYGRPRSEWAGVLSMLLGFGAWLVTVSVEHVASPESDGLVAAITTVPSDFWGLGCGILGYALGNRWGSSRERTGGFSRSPSR